MLLSFITQGTDRDQLFHRRSLCHGIDKLIGHDIQLIDFLFLVGIQHHFDGADQGVQSGRIADMGCLGNDVCAEPPEVAHCLVAYDTEVNTDPGIIPFLHFSEHFPEQV